MYYLLIYNIVQAKIAMLVMATGKYLVYVRELVESARRFVLTDHEVVFYVFTDGQINNMNGVEVIPQVMTLDRYTYKRNILTHSIATTRLAI